MISEKDIKLFTQGYCDIFAVELHRQFKYPLFFVAQKAIWQHVVVKRKGKYVDIRGAVSLKQLLAEYKSDRVLTQAEVRYNLSYCSCCKDIQQLAKKIIKENPKRFA